LRADLSREITLATGRPPATRNKDLGADRQRIARFFPTTHRDGLVASERQRIAWSRGGDECSARHSGSRALALPSTDRPWEPFREAPGGSRNPLGKPPASSDEHGPGQVLRGDCLGGRRGDTTATSPRRECWFGPTFLGVMRWRSGDSPDRAMRCRSALREYPDNNLTLIRNLGCPRSEVR
jgi:hypothetical protein